MKCNMKQHKNMEMIQYSTPSNPGILFIFFLFPLDMPLIEWYYYIKIKNGGK